MKNKALSFRAVMAVGIGCVIGTGIVTITGSAIGITGRSVWIAYAAAVFFGYICTLPFIYMSSALKLSGGGYSTAEKLLGPSWAGIYAYNYIIVNLSLALTAKSIGIYFHSLYSALDEKWISIIGLTLFFLINLQGMKMMSGIQQWLAFFMLSAFGIFCLCGCLRLNGGAFDFSAPDYFPKGFQGLQSAMVMLVFSTTTAQTLLSLGDHVEQPTRIIPKAINYTFAVVFVTYVAIAVVAGNVLSVSEVAFKPLTYVAKEVLPAPLFVFFMVGGPIGAIFTTLNAMFSVASRPIMAAAEDGWFPVALSAQNRHGQPKWIMLGLYLLALIPLILDLDVATITNNMVLIQYAIKFLMVMAAWNLPKRYPEEWSESHLHMSLGRYRLLMGFVFAVHIWIISVAAKNLPPALLGFTVAAMAVLTILALLRQKTAGIR